MGNTLDRKVFLKDRENTGRFIVKYLETGKEYFVETINDNAHRSNWGSYNPSTGRVENKKGHDKHLGSITSKESLITQDNGFNDIHELGVGVSPLEYIDRLHQEYKKNIGVA